MNKKEFIQRLRDLGKTEEEIQKMVEDIEKLNLDDIDEWKNK